MKTRIIYLTRTRPVLTEPERRAALGALSDSHPVVLTIQDELDEALVRTAGDMTERQHAAEQRSYDAGYLAAVADLRARIEELRRSSG